MIIHFKRSLVAFTLVYLALFASGLDAVERAPLLTKQQVVDGFNTGITTGATHMLIVWDTFDFDDSYNFIVFSYPNDNVHTLIENYNVPGYYRVSAVFAMHKDLEEQLTGTRWYPEY